MFFNIETRKYIANPCKKCDECDWETKKSKGTNQFFKFFCRTCKKGYYFCPFCDFIHEKEAVFINHFNDEHFRVALTPLLTSVCIICDKNSQNKDFITHCQEHVADKYEEYQSQSFLRNYAADVVPFVDQSRTFQHNEQVSPQTSTDSHQNQQAVSEQVSASSTQFNLKHFKTPHLQKGEDIQLTSI